MRAHAAHSGCCIPALDLRIVSRVIVDLAAVCIDIRVLECRIQGKCAGHGIARKIRSVVVIDITNVPSYNKRGGSDMQEASKQIRDSSAEIRSEAARHGPCAHSCEDPDGARDSCSAARHSSDAGAP